MSTVRGQTVTVEEHTYTAVFEPAEEGGYVVSFPAIPGIATQGETLEEARDMAADLLRGYLEILRENGRPLPASGVRGNDALQEPVTVKLQTA